MPTTQSPSHVKDHNEITLHRAAIVAADPVLADIGKRLGMNMAGYEEAIVEIHPSGGADPAFAVFWWSEHSSTWIADQTPLVIAAAGANVRYTLTIACKHRRMFIRTTAVATPGTVDIRVAGHRNVIEGV